MGKDTSIYNIILIIIMTIQSLRSFFYVQIMCISILNRTFVARLICWSKIQTFFIRIEYVNLSKCENLPLFNITTIRIVSVNRSSILNAYKYLKINHKVFKRWFIEANTSRIHTQCNIFKKTYKKYKYIQYCQILKFEIAQHAIPNKQYFHQINRIWFDFNWMRLKTIQHEYYYDFTIWIFKTVTHGQISSTIFSNIDSESLVEKLIEWRIGCTFDLFQHNFKGESVLRRNGGRPLGVGTSGGTNVGKRRFDFGGRRSWKTGLDFRSRRKASFYVPFEERKAIFEFGQRLLNERKAFVERKRRLEFGSRLSNGKLGRGCVLRLLRMTLVKYGIDSGRRHSFRHLSRENGVSGRIGLRTRCIMNRSLFTQRERRFHWCFREESGWFSSFRKLLTSCPLDRREQTKLFSGRLLRLRLLRRFYHRFSWWYIFSLLLRWRVLLSSRWWSRRNTFVFRTSSRSIGWTRSGSRKQLGFSNRLSRRRWSFIIGSSSGSIGGTRRLLTEAISFGEQKGGELSWGGPFSIGISSGAVIVGASAGTVGVGSGSSGVSPGEANVGSGGSGGAGGTGGVPRGLVGRAAIRGEVRRARRGEGCVGSVGVERALNWHGAAAAPHSVRRQLSGVDTCWVCLQPALVWRCFLVLCSCWCGCVKCDRRYHKLLPFDLSIHQC